MRGTPAEQRTEVLRKLVHVGSGLLVLTLAVLTWQQALVMALSALALNVLVLPRLPGRPLHRSGQREKGFDWGIVFYPASVAFLIVVFRDAIWIAAFGWILMAFGDGIASVAGILAGKHPIPWNPRKSIEGTIAFAVAGLAVGVPVVAWLARGSWSLPVVVLLVVPVTLTVALLETLETGIDDNLTVPIGGALLMAWGHAVLLADGPDVVRLFVALAICTVMAIVSVMRGSLTIPGAILATVVGTVIAGFAGWVAFVLLVLFFGFGTSATKLGRRVKESRGIAEARGGRRGVGNVVANGGLAAMLAPLAAMDARYMVALAAAIATAAFDTVSSEVGKAFGKRTFLITKMTAVPPGTEGAVSLEGTLAGFAAAVMLALVAALAPATGLTLMPAAVAIVAGAFAGSTFESVVGALASTRGHVIQNDALNFVNTCVGAAAGAFTHVLLGYRIT